MGLTSTGPHSAIRLDHLNRPPAHVSSQHLTNQRTLEPATEGNTPVSASICVRRAKAARVARGGCPSLPSAKASCLTFHYSNEMLYMNTGTIY